MMDFVDGKLMVAYVCVETEGERQSESERTSIIHPIGFLSLWPFFHPQILSHPPRFVFSGYLIHLLIHVLAEFLVDHIAVFLTEWSHSAQACTG